MFGLFKAAQVGPEQMGKLLGAMGITVDVQPVKKQDAGPAFQQAARKSMQPGAQLHRMRGTMKDGSQVEALFILVPRPAPAKGNLTAPAIVA